MPTYPLLPQAQAYGYEIGILLLDEIETHVPGDTAHAGTYPFPVLFKVVPGASATRITTGDPTAEADVVAAARELARMGVKGISSNCGFMLHYQSAVTAAVHVPVMLSSLLQIPLACQVIGPEGRLGILTAFTKRLKPDVLALAGLPEGTKYAVSSIEDSPEFKGLAERDLDTDRFGERLLDAAQELVQRHPDIRAILLECALFPPYAKSIQDTLRLPVFDFVSLIDHLHAVVRRR